MGDGITEDQLLAVIDEAAGSHLIEALPGRLEAYRFTHALIQQTLSEEMTPSRKVRLHARIAQVLETIYRDSAVAHAAELAHHFAEAQLVLGPRNVVRYSMLAGEKSFANYAWEESEVHFQRALDAKGVPLTSAESASDFETAELLYGLGRAQLAMLRVDEGWATMGRSFDYYAEAGNFSRIVDIADHPIDIAVPGNVAPLLDRALDIVPPDSYEAGRLLPWHGRILSALRGDYRGAEEAWSRALDIAQREGDTSLELKTLAHAAEGAGTYLRWNQCLEKGMQAVELTGKVDNPLAESLAHHWVWFSLGALGQDSEGARRHAMAAMAAAERLHDRSLLARTLVNLCNLFSAWGDWQTARQFSDRGLALAPQSAFPVRTLLEYQIGDFERGEWYLGRDQEVVGLTDHRTSPRRASIVLTTVARITGVSESLDTAKAPAEAVLSSSSATPFYTYAANISLGLIAVERGDAAAAADQYSALKPYRGTMLAPGIWWTSGDRMLGLLTHTMGDLDQAAVHFEEAVVFCRRAGYRPELAWSCCDYANMLMARAHGHATGSGRTGGGDSAKALALLDESLSIATDLGMRPLVERVNQRIEQVQALPETPPAYPDGLSHREVEVLRLIASGKTNLEIAEGLVIAEGTARRHVANIYEKIGAANRVEAASYAAQHGLSQ